MHRGKNKRASPGSRELDIDETYNKNRYYLMKNEETCDNPRNANFCEIEEEKRALGDSIRFDFLSGGFHTREQSHQVSL